jgi:hypothetical protein
MLPYVRLTRVVAGQSIYYAFSDSQSKELLIYSNAEKLGWSYIDERNGYPYKLYSLILE